MMLETDIWQTAQRMIETHGDRAALQAASKSEQMLAKGDQAGGAMWKQIITAIVVLGVAAPGAVER